MKVYTELKSCPFCGEAARIRKHVGAKSSDTRWYAFCLGCGAEGGWAKTNEAARGLWNMRVKTFAIHS